MLLLLEKFEHGEDGTKTHLRSERSQVSSHKQVNCFLLALPANI